MTALPETFRCLPLSCSLTRAACAQRHERAMNGGRVAGARISDARLMSSACVGCEVGAAHARGEAPDVSIASVWARAKEERMPRETVIEHEGEKRTLKAWAEKAGIARETLRKRLASGDSMAVALARPVAPTGRPRDDAPSPETLAKRKERARHRAKASVERRDLPQPSGRAMVDAWAKAQVAGETTRRPEPVERVTALASPQHAVDVLTRLGFIVEDAGLVPAGRVILIRDGARS